GALFGNALTEDTLQQSVDPSARHDDLLSKQVALQGTLKELRRLEAILRVALQGLQYDFRKHRRVVRTEFPRINDGTVSYEIDRLLWALAAEQAKAGCELKEHDA